MPKPAPPRGRPPASIRKAASTRGPAPTRGRKAPELFDAPPPREDQRKLFRVAGLAAVSALFKHEPNRVERLFFEERMRPHLTDACKVMAAARKPYRMVDAEELAKVAGTVLHGGVVALMTPRAVPALDLDAARRWAADKQPLLILDGIGNPHNLGAILRTAAFFGLPRVLLSGHSGQAMPSEAAYRVAEGGFEWVRLYQAVDLPGALKRLQGCYRVVGTALGEGGRAITRPSDLSKSDRPPALVLGNEEEGIPAATLAACEERLTLPGSGRVQSLNVAATAAILIHALSGA